MVKWGGGEREREHGPRHGHGAEGALFWGSKVGVRGETPGKFSGL